MTQQKVKIWTKGDIDGFFGLFTNNLTNLLIMAGLLNLSIGLPAKLVYGEILPAVGLSIFVSSIFYTYMAYRLSKCEKRLDVTALPTGVSVPHMFLIVFLIMGPVYWKSGDPYLAWFTGLTWCLINGLIAMSGSIIGPKLRDILPRPAMLGTLTGVSLTFIVMTPAMNTWEVPYIGFVSLVIILLGWFGKVNAPFKIPIGLVAIVVGTIIGWATGYMDIKAVTDSFNHIGFSLPAFSVSRLIDGFGVALPFLASAVPLGIYNFMETIDNLESASVAGDHYNTRQALVFDATSTIVASLFGSPFPIAVYIGHAGWKEAGARIGYSWMTGLSVLILTWLGLISLLHTLIPLVAILPILIYIGLIIGAQAFQSTDKKYAPAIILAMIPWLANWGQNIIDTAINAAQTTAKEIGFSAIAQSGLNYSGMVTLGAGAIIVGMIWSSILVFIIDQNFKNAGIASLVGSLLSFFGIIHYETVSFAVGTEMSLSYLVISFIFIMLHIKKNKRYLGGIIHDKTINNESEAI
ncbi:xanthine permease [Bacillus sp. B-jedd]|uniref:xanthine permease n=1 Tax=Bacillus sp. B-jedd TaxID=1476857 RepID=UPI0005155CEA|nr:xanthine permease [Bacillus sp. B-jedd]CEG25591.1 xanthine/uracil/vitamin C permease [Bacillus sp. B-jedd]